MNVKLHIIGLILIVFKLNLFNSMNDEEWLLLSETVHDNIGDEIEVNGRCLTSLNIRWSDCLLKPMPERIFWIA